MDFLVFKFNNKVELFNNNLKNFKTYASSACAYTSIKSHDRGVHAYEQYFHFDTELNIEPKQWKYAMNSALPEDIYVNSVKQVDDTFHCRYDCVGKRYRYKVYQAEHRNPFESGLKTFIKDDLDLVKMNEAAKHFIGTHDFTGFCSQKTEVESKERTLYQSEVVKRTKVLTISSQVLVSYIIWCVSL